MLTFILRRLLSAIPTLILVSLFVFTLQKLLPGDPVQAMAGEERDPAVMEYLREKYRLNDPLPLQYVHWVGNVLQGDFGTSLRTEQPVTVLLASKLPVTIELAVLALIIALVIGIPTGVISAVRKGTSVDYAANVFALSGISIPHFWLGILLIMIFAVKLQWLPASGFVPLGEDVGQNLKTLILPAFVLGAGLSGVLMRHTRSAMLEVLRADYVRTARAKGLFPRTVN
jgi:peptide/nickel transport system permease protein